MNILKRNWKSIGFAVLSRGFFPLDPSFTSIPFTSHKSFSLSYIDVHMHTIDMSLHITIRWLKIFTCIYTPSLQLILRTIFFDNFLNPTKHQYQCIDWCWVESSINGVRRLNLMWGIISKTKYIIAMVWCSSTLFDQKKKMFVDVIVKV